MRARGTILLFAAALAVYLGSAYGGIRSADSELVYRVAESMATEGRARVREDLAQWPGFGVARGRDGEIYAVFGPLESLAMAPFIAAGRALGAEERWFRGTDARVPVSHYVGDGFREFVEAQRPADPGPHALRFAASLVNPLAAAAAVAAFASIAARVASPAAAAATACLFAFGSLWWPYAGACFSEPLAGLLTLLALRALVPARADAAPPLARARAGLWLGLASTAHLTALLFAPPFAWLAAGAPRRAASALPALRALAPFAAGLALPLAALALFDAARFGDPFETGRGVIPEAQQLAFGYGRLANPIPGMLGLLVSAGKGLVFFCPAVLIGLAGLRLLGRARPELAICIAASAVLRIGFLATRSDWHGGFALGPRYLVPLVPLLLLPAATLFDAWAARPRRLAALVAASALCASQQLYFALGEIFSYDQLIRLRLLERGQNVLDGDRLYFDWSLSPLAQLHRGLRGPFALQAVALETPTLWALGSLLVAVAAAGAWAALRRSDPPRAQCAGCEPSGSTNV